jgi:hypothetical protein
MSSTEVANGDSKEAVFEYLRRSILRANAILTSG